MKVLIVGAGIIGTIYGWAVAEAGHDITHIVRPGHAVKLANGVSIDMFDRRAGHKKRNICHYNLKAEERIDPSDRYDLVMVPTHHYELIDALNQYVPLINQDAGFILLTQNWKGTSEVDRILPQSHYLYADAKAGGTFKDGSLIATIKGVDLGQVNDGHDDCLQKAMDLFSSANLNPRYRENIIHYLWVQYAISGGLMPALVRAGSIESVLRDRSLGELALKAVRECLDVVARRGVDFGAYPETRPFYSSSFIYKQIALSSMKFAFGHDEYTKRASAHGLQNPREIRTFFFDLLETGLKLGVSMPVMTSFKQDIEMFSAKHDDL